MVLPQPDCSRHAHRPSIVLAMAVQRGSCLAREGIYSSKREKDQACKQIQELRTQGGSIQRVEAKGE